MDTLTMQWAFDFQKKNLKKGFSMIELLIVLSLIIILSTIVVPRYSYLKNSAKIVEAKQGLTQLYRLQKTFYIENGYYTGEGLDFDFSSEFYRVGFNTKSWGAKVTEALSNCTVTDNHFKAGSVNEENKLPNLTINEKNCMLKIQKKSSSCSQTTGECISY